jgi:hypothetical protein
MGQGGRAVSSHKALHHWHTTMHVLSSAQKKARQVSAAGTVIEHGHSFSLHDGPGINLQIDGLERTKKKLMEFFAWHLAEGLEPFSFEICVASLRTNLAFQLGLQLSNLFGKV